MPNTAYTGGLFDGHFGPMQPALFEMQAENAMPPSAPSVAEVCLYRFASRFRRRYEDLGRPHRLPAEVDALPFVCVMLAASDQVWPAAPIVQELYACRDILEAITGYAEVERLPFDVCLQILHQPVSGVERMIRYLNAGGSQVRVFAFDVAWLVRHRLPADRMIGRLLANVEDTLGYWLESLALCRHLFASAEEFWQVADAYEASEMPDQYADRLRGVHEGPSLVEYPVHFLDLELRCRTMLDAVALSIRELPSDYLSFEPDDQGFVPDEAFTYPR